MKTNDITIKMCFILSSLPVTWLMAAEKLYNTSRQLDEMLFGYDKQLRPGFGGKPLTVNVYINLRSMGPISELKMVYTMDCYFRQTWNDERLSMNNSLENMPLGITILERIWHPDTVFFNGQNSYLHTITTPNKFIRISPNGNVLYSQRLTIQANCIMDLKRFPMDIQRCPLHFGSFAYSEKDVIYKWRYDHKKSIETAKGIWLSQFDLVDNNLYNYTSDIKGAIHTILSVRFHLYRNTGYFIIQIYVPCALLVILSWVAFWINREATADRIALGTTTVLTMTLLGIENKNAFPKVSYSTALDLYVGICFAFVLSTIVEFAFVHYFTKFGTGEPFLYDSSDDDSSFDEECTDTEDKDVIYKVNGINGLDGVTDTQQTIKQPSGRYSFLSKLCSCLTETKGYKGMQKRDMQKGFSNSVSKIDRMCRILFPVAFLVFNAVYWISYSRWAPR